MSLTVRKTPLFIRKRPLPEKRKPVKIIELASLAVATTAVVVAGFAAWYAKGQRDAGVAQVAAAKGQLDAANAEVAIMRAQLDDARASARDADKATQTAQSQQAELVQANKKLADAAAETGKSASQFASVAANQLEQMRQNQRPILSITSLRTSEAPQYRDTYVQIPLNVSVSVSGLSIAHDITVFAQGTEHLPEHWMDTQKDMCEHWIHVAGYANGVQPRNIQISVTASPGQVLQFPIYPSVDVKKILDEYKGSDVVVMHVIGCMRYKDVQEAWHYTGFNEEVMFKRSFLEAAVAGQSWNLQPEDVKISASSMGNGISN